MNNRQPLVTVVIPVFNGEKFLSSCLESVCSMTYRNLEVIVVDDGSTDSTADIITQWALNDSRLKLVQQANAGPSAARNTGIEQAAGQYIMFVDADDIVAPWLVTHLMQLIVHHGSDGAITRFGHTCGAMTTDPARSATGCTKGRSVAADMLYQRRYAHTPYAMLLDRKLLGDNRFKQGILFEDMELMPRLMYKASKIATSDAVGYMYRYNPASLLHRFKPQLFDCLQVTASLVDYFENEGDRELTAAARDRALNAAFYSLRLAAHRPQYHGTVMKPCWEYIKKWRMRSLFDPHVRLKTRLGIIASLPGLWLMKLLTPKPKQ